MLVIDSDESNFGLHRQLGLTLPEDFTHYFGHKKGIFEEGAQEIFAGGWHLEDIPEEYLSSDGSVRLMAIGKIADAGEGCACAMGALAKVFLEHLTLRDDEVAIIDTEAGVEHFGRGVDQFAVDGNSVSFRLRGFDPKLKSLGAYATALDPSAWLASALKNASAFDLELSLEVDGGSVSAKALKDLLASVKKAAASRRRLSFRWGSIPRSSGISGAGAPFRP